MTRVIRADRIPKTLSGSKIAQALSLAQAGKFPSYWNARDVRRSLWQSQNQKCCYCERSRDLTRESDIDHFRPKSRYWWLAYEWHNLLFTCRACNQEYKRDLFPLQDEARRAGTPSEDLVAEGGMLLDPASEDPEPYFSWDWTTCSDPDPAGKQLVFVCALTPRAEVTRTVLGLNREDLAEERYAAVLAIDAIETMYRCGEHSGNPDLRQQALDRLKEELAPQREFLALRRYCARSYRSWRKRVEEIIREAGPSNP